MTDTLHRIARADCPLQPWKNGGGSTRELLVWPPDADAGNWSMRLSIATIDRDGPFSPYPGIERHLAVIDGAVALRWPTGARWVCRGDQPLVFDGADAPDARLPAGSIDDISLMLRRSRGSGGMWPVRAGEPWSSTAAWRGLYTTADLVLRRGEGLAVPVPAHTLVWHLEHSTAGETPSHRAPDAWTLDGTAARGKAGWWIAHHPALTGASP